MVRLLGLLFIILLGFNSCKTKQNLVVTEAKSNTSSKREINKEYQLKSGVKYTLSSLGDGPKVHSGDEVYFHYLGKLSTGKVFDNSRERYQPIGIKIGSGLIIKGLEQALLEMYKGDKAIITIPPNLAYGNKDLEVIPPNSTLVFELELVEVRPYKPYTYQAIQGDTLQTNSGLRYIVLKAGNGNPILPKQKAMVNYAGFLWDGTKFDSSYDTGIPYHFTVGTGEVIQAWDEILPLMKKTEKVRIIVPPHLGYGDKGSPPEIPPHSRLIFDIELLEISN